MQSSITKPLLRAATAYTFTSNNPTRSSSPGVKLCQQLALSPYFTSTSTTTTTTTTTTGSTNALVPNNTLHFLRRNITTRAYPLSKTYRTPFLPMGTLALLGSAILFLGNSTASALSFYPFTSRPSPSDRMKERLEKHGYIEKPVVPDGNCQMRAIADQMLGDEKYHPVVRSKITAWLRSNEKFSVDDSGSATLGDFIDRDQYPKWDSYISHMSRNAVWGDHITLVAASETFGVTIVVLSNVEDNGTGNYITSITPRSTKSTKTIYLSHWHEMHYNSLKPTDKQPLAQAA